MDVEVKVGKLSFQDFQLEALHKAWRPLARQEAATLDLLLVRLVGAVPSDAVFGARYPEGCCGRNASS